MSAIDKTVEVLDDEQLTTVVGGATVGEVAWWVFEAIIAPESISN